MSLAILFSSYVINFRSSNMKTYLSDIHLRLNKFSKSLDQTAMLAAIPPIVRHQ
jgi:hypothetical protein